MLIKINIVILESNWIIMLKMIIYYFLVILFFVEYFREIFRCVLVIIYKNVCVLVLIVYIRK